MDGYKLLQHIGGRDGGQGVMLMEDEKGDKYVVKRVDLAMLSEDQRKQSMQECELLMALRHPNIVKYRESVSTGRNHYTVMEYCKGGSLEKLIAERRSKGAQPFPENQVLRWLGQLCTALQYCHDNNVLHRDIKSANCFLSSDHKDILLGDFGIAKVLESSVSVAQTIVGSPCSMSPEVIQGRSYNQSSDVWSLGCLFYEMCALRKPFSSHSLNQLVQQVTSEKPPPPPPKSSQTIQNILFMLLRKDPLKRCTLNELLALPALQMALPKTSVPSPQKSENDSVPLSMNAWLRQHYANLEKITCYLQSMKRSDEDVVRQQLQKAKPRTPDMNQDRLRHNPKKRHSAPLAAAVPPKPLNARQARELREAELEEKRQKIQEEKENRRQRERELEEQQMIGRRQNMEERRAAALQRQNQMGHRPNFQGGNRAERDNEPPKKTQQERERDALEEKRKRILRERENRKNRDMLAEEKAQLDRRANAEQRRKAAEVRRGQQQKGRPPQNIGFASTYKGQSSSSSQLMEDPPEPQPSKAGKMREGYRGPPDVKVEVHIPKDKDKDKKVAPTKVRTRSEPAIGHSATDDVLEDRREMRRIAQDKLRQQMLADRQRAMRAKGGNGDVNFELCLPNHLLALKGGKEGE